MKQRLRTEWNKLDHVVIVAAIRQRRRLCCCILEIVYNSTLNKFRSCHVKCAKTFFDSVTNLQDHLALIQWTFQDGTYVVMH